MVVVPSPASQWLKNDSEPKTKSLYIMSNDPEAQAFNPPAPVPCEYCGKPRHTKGFRTDDSVIWLYNGLEDCNCPERLKAELTRKLVAESGMSARFKRRTFETFQQTAENQRPLRVCKAYAENFWDKLPTNNPEPGRNGLFITGPMGTGKTHLVAAIANHIMQEGTAVLCMTMIDLLDNIKRTYEKNRRRGDSSEEDILNAYKKVPFLIIDDMGKEAATEWAVQKIYAIINARYEAYMPVIITTNYTDSELVGRLTPKETGDPTTAEATIDRLREMCAAIVTTGESWRSK